MYDVQQLQIDNSKGFPSAFRHVMTAHVRSCLNIFGSPDDLHGTYAWLHISTKSKADSRNFRNTILFYVTVVKGNLNLHWS